MNLPLFLIAVCLPFACVLSWCVGVAMAVAWRSPAKTLTDYWRHHWLIVVVVVILLVLTPCVLAVILRAFAA